MSQLQEQIANDVKTAMKAKEKQKVQVLRSLMAALKNEQIESEGELDDEGVQTVVARHVKQLKDARADFVAAERDDLVEQQDVEIAIAAHYLPEQLDDDELRKIVTDTADELGASSKQDFGRVMGAVMPKVKGRAEGDAVKRIVNELL